MPLQRCRKNGKGGWRWGTRGKCYPGKGGRRRAIKQAIAIRASQRRRGKRTEPLTANVRNPLRMDPTRTATLRRRFSQDLSGRFLRLKSSVLRLVVDEDAFGLKLTVNFNPNQPRDKFGRWSSGGGGSFAKTITEEAAEQAIEDYTTDKFQEINEGLRDGSIDGSHPVVSGVDEYLKSQPKRSGVTVRSFDTEGSDTERIRNMLISGEFTDEAFISTRKIPTLTDRIAFSQKLAPEGKVVLRVEGKSGVDISKISLNPGEGEVLYPRGTKFKVTNFLETDGGGLLAELEETVTINVRMLNQRFAFLTDQEKLAAFRLWVEEQVRNDILPILDETQLENAYWQAYVEDGYRKGAGRAFDDVKRPGLATTPEQRAFMAGSREQFLRSTLGQPVAIEKVKLLASRVFTDLKGITQAMSTQLTRALADGLVQGASPRTVARNITRSIEGIGRNRALMLARTEIIRAHAEGALDAMENLGVDEVGVMVEWSTAGFNVCPKCRALDGIVLKVSEARGLFPRHANCRCSPIPANVGEPKTGQIRGKRSIEKARDKSIKAELPKRKKRSLAAQKRRTSWLGASRRFSKKRPRSPV